ncbi:hypothetical protein BTVI_24832 [Pitangus sulphuratus]|nr:hypothetical protein BTVI_24832 [Pitangus sulphuratus]
MPFFHVINEDIKQFVDTLEPTSIFQPKPHFVLSPAVTTFPEVPSVHMALTEHYLYNLQRSSCEGYSATVKPIKVPSAFEYRFTLSNGIDSYLREVRILKILEMVTQSVQPLHQVKSLNLEEFPWATSRLKVSMNSEETKNVFPPITSRDQTEGKYKFNGYFTFVQDGQHFISVGYNLLHYFTKYRSETDRPVVSGILLLALHENWDIRQLPVSWDLSGFPRPLKNHQQRFCNDISQLFEDSGMNPIRPHRLLVIQLEQHMPHNFKVNWELIILTVMVLQLRALTLPSIIHIEDRGKESVKHLCLVSVPICEVTILILQWANDISILPIAINMFEKNLFILFPMFLASFNYS